MAASGAIPERSESTQRELNGLTRQDMKGANANPGQRVRAGSTASSTSSSSSATVPGGASGYEPWYPNNIPFDSALKRFVRRFFEVSDDPERNDEWMGFFHEDATVIMGDDVAKGGDEIRQLRRRMWKDVEARKHRLVKVFPGHFSPDAAIVSMHEAEFMLFGAVAYRMKDEEQPDAVASWAGHAKLRRDSLAAPWKFAFWRVYLQR